MLIEIAVSLTKFDKQVIPVTIVKFTFNQTL